MRYLLDANSCVDYLRRSQQSHLAARMQTEAVGNLCLCSIVRSELLYGALRSRDPAGAVRKVDEFCAGFFSFPFDDRAADRCGELRAHLARLGTPIGPNDMLIAAIALQHGLTVVTNNVREFRRVPALPVEDWSQP